MKNNTIIQSLKTRIQQVVPGGRVMLFGSRAKGTETEESDWDILVLTPHPVTPTIRTLIHNALFPISVQIGSFINTLVVQEDEWANNPSYYSLHQTVDNEMVLQL